MADGGARPTGQPCEQAGARTPAHLRVSNRHKENDIMKRFKILFGQRRFQLLASLGAVVLAVSVVAASGASFTAHSANASNVFTNGTLSMSNQPSGMSVSITNMVPGDSHTGTIAIANTGDVQGNFYLEPVAVKDSMGGLYADDLVLTITDGGTGIYKGSLSGLGQIDLGVWQPKDQHTYEFTVAFPDQGRDGAGVGVDNQYMGATASADFNWTTVSVSKGAL
jgi:hypothetical protein